MKKFIYTPIANGKNGLLGYLSHQGIYECNITIYEKVFYIGGKDTHIIPVDNEILSFIQRMQKKKFIVNNITQKF
jgi:hypothetical protein